MRLTLALTLYDLLAGVTGSTEAHCHFNRTEFAQCFPCLNDASLKGGFTYLDAQTDDARFVLELIDGALASGAVVLNYCEVTSFIETQGQICGAYVFDKAGAKPGRVYARQIVNATGQWLTTTPQGQAWCSVTKGVHLILPNVLAGEALLLTAQQDGRVFFMIPWYGLTLLGTTDTHYTGNIEQVKVEKDDIDYLLHEANCVLKSANWTEADIIGQYAGLRVLKHSSAVMPSAVSRDWELKIADNGLLHSVGGKFTSAREDAASIVDSLCENLQVQEPCKTFGLPFPWLPDADFQTWAQSVRDQATKLGIDADSTHWLIRRHAKRVVMIFQLIENNPDWAKRIFPDLAFIYADLIFCARYEMVVHLEDLLRRRMPLLILAKLTHAQIMHLAEIVATELNWNQGTCKEEADICCQKWRLPPL
jgi:glycerol-3-phosphate dehydrogenase